MDFDSASGQLPHGIEETLKTFKSEVNYPSLSDDASIRSRAILASVRSRLHHAGWTLAEVSSELSAVNVSSQGIGYVVAVTEDFEVTSTLHEGNLQEAKYPWQRVTSSPSRRPTGRLRLIIERVSSSPRLVQRWSDTTRWRIEDKLDSCINSITHDAEISVEAERERIAAAEQRFQGILRARERAWLAERHDRNLTRLRAQTAAWAESEQIRAYAARLLAHAEADGQEWSTDITAWADWAMNAAASLDPLQDPKNLAVDHSFTNDRSALRPFLPSSISPYEGGPPSLA